ncbi:DNA-binding transcriptional MerR regulator [Microbacterium resistens]|uniref:DNA-binding transcriptional MerR regulator n=1 Tax=Microbacterium resistens TaxID=156977 RepID=A0ABU1SD12_9MICO|nr:MerR family DNA-binding transcriptional regulator [Microbacterium resistens]MDR6867492.1 DNA-binding transcriptional MerR regulator [Microbacterium resistens]
MLIGEVSERSGISARMLRHYDRIGLVSPSDRTPSGYRRYSEDDVRRLFHVEGLRTLGLGLKDIAEALDDLSFAPSAMVERLVARTRERIAHEEELLARLTRVQSSGPAAWSDVLRTIGLLRGLDASSASVRQRTALSTAGTGAQDVAVLVEAVLGETDPNTAGALQWAIARAGAAAIPALAAALHSPAPDRRHRALETLVKIDDPRADEAVAEAHRHPDPVIAARAVLARGRAGNADAITALVALVAEGRDDVEAAEVLGALAVDHGHDAPATRALIEALATAEAPARSRLAAALAEIPGAQARDALVGLLDDADRGVALTARAILRGRGADEPSAV